MWQKPGKMNEWKRSDRTVSQRESHFPMKELKLDLGWFRMYFGTLIGQLETL